MSPEPMLERSVLERKERDELRAIADAMGLQAGSRTKKGDLVDQILRATGIEPTGSASTNGDTAPARPDAPGSNDAGASGDGEAISAKPKRATRKKAVATIEPPEAEVSVGGPAENAGDDVADGGAASNGHAPIAEATSDAGSDAPVGENAPAAVAEGSSSDTTIREGRGPRDERGPRENRGPRDNRGGQNNQNQQGGGQGGQNNQGGPRFDSSQPEAGNSRSRRRRRGRDRDQRGGGGQGGGEFRGGGGGGDRELQGGNQQQEQAFSGEPVPVAGVLDVTPEGWGFIRTRGYLPNPNDIYVSTSQVRRFALRKGDRIEGASRPAGPQEKYPALLQIDKVCGLTPDEARDRPFFENLTSLFPDEKLKLEVPGRPTTLTCRIVDLISPIGKGQRGLIVSPPKAGKTTVMKQIAQAIEQNNPEVHLMVLLVDERPEEVTDMKRSIQGEVVASTFDRPSSEHTLVAELAVERAKRLVELGKDVVIILDGITRLSRAYNLAAPASGRLLSGGIDSAALYPPKRFFGAARNAEEGGSLTILATALVDTGSKMDEVIFEEFKGTGNMELRLDRKISERRIYPAIDVNASSTRHEDLLFDRAQLELVWRLRRALNGLADEGTGAGKALEMLLDGLKKTSSNDEFLALAAKSQNPAG
ncbi:MAG TPA: transcription termination factor Rho [Acidimicrobiales bacterium]|nr:transcription termination factor Rho [Acidimicrobiales bacterium]